MLRLFQYSIIFQLVLFLVPYAFADLPSAIPSTATASTTTDATNSNPNITATIVPELSGLDLIKKKQITVSLDQAKLGTVVIFLSTKCPCSNSYIPILSGLAVKYGKSKEFQFLGVHSNADEDAEKAVTYFTSLDLPFPVIQDTKMKIADFYEAFKTPHAFIIDPLGKVLFKGGVGNQSIYQEGRTKNYLEDALAALSSGKEVPEKSVRTLGCLIKRPEEV